MTIIGIDPGNEQTALVEIDEQYLIKNKAILDNESLYKALAMYGGSNLHFVAEMPQCFGMPVGKTVLETCFAVGRIAEITMYKGRFSKVYRSDIKLHFCHSMRAKDATVRQALIDRFGDPGTKKAQGHLYGIKKDLWSAFAIAVHYLDKLQEKKVA